MADPGAASLDAYLRLTKRGGASVVLVVLVNAGVLVQAVVQGWTAADVMATFQIESAVIGVLNVPRILAAQQSGVAERIGTTFFFLFHYFFFLAIQSVFLFVWLSALVGGFKAGAQMLPAAATFVVSHAYSLYRNYFKGGEYRRVTANDMMFRPYSRVFPMQFAVVGGIFALQMFGIGWSMTPALILVAIKTGIDVASHLGERKKQSDPELSP